MVKEIAAASGEILRQFGALVPRYDLAGKKQSPDFKFLPDKYHGLECGSTPMQTSMEVMNEISRATSMVLMNDRYLLISHSSPGNLRSVNEWIFYDLAPLESAQKIKAYSLNGAAYESLNGIGRTANGAIIQNSINGRITSRENRIYVYKPPSAEEADISNGSVEVYGLSFDVNATAGLNATAPDL